MYTFSSDSLKWVKNVKRDRGNEWAYDDVLLGSNFFLHWSKQFKNNLLKPAIGELILIFQTVNNPKGTYLTHIVTPIDNKIILDTTSKTHPYKREVALIAKATPIDSIPKPSDLSFHRPNRGACCDINLIKQINTNADIMESVLQKRIIDLFENNTNENLDEMFNLILNPRFDEEDYFTEGEEKLILKKHKYYERNPEIIRRAKENAIRNGILFCEICGFDFSKKYPNIGNKFIECHHKSPIAKGGIRNTTINDLALVCSNCHRMLHKRYNGEYYSIEKLKGLLNKNL